LYDNHTGSKRKDSMMNLDEMEALIAEARGAIRAEVLKNIEDEVKAKEAMRLRGIQALDRARTYQ
jgi:peptide subunit release factor 1 (eRF1)